jgi:hypothetical protein
LLQRGFLICVLVLTLSATSSANTAEASTGTSDVPMISILSPIHNSTYDERDIWLNFRITKPDCWIKPTIGNPILPVNLGKITQVAYIIDGIEIENIAVDDNEVHTIPMSIKRNFDFSFNLTELSSGEHSVQVFAYGEVYVSGGTSKTGSEPFSPVVTAPIVANSSIINFTVKPSPTPNSPMPTINTGSLIEPFPFPLLVVASIIVAVVIAVLLLYKRNRKPAEARL